jgi:hypothetical protein
LRFLSCPAGERDRREGSCRYAHTFFRLCEGETEVLFVFGRRFGHRDFPSVHPYPAVGTVFVILVEGERTLTRACPPLWRCAHLTLSFWGSFLKGQREARDKTNERGTGDKTSKAGRMRGSR